MEHKLCPHSTGKVYTSLYLARTIDSVQIKGVSSFHICPLKLCVRMNYPIRLITH